MVDVAAAEVQAAFAVTDRFQARGRVVQPAGVVVDNHYNGDVGANTRRSHADGR